MKRPMLSAIVLLLVVPLLSSCMGLRQINELAIVTAVGLQEGSRPGNVKLSVQIIRPADARGQTGAPAGGTGEPIYSVSAEGKSIFDAIRNLGRFSSRRVYWAHNFVIVMDEQYARRGIRDMIDFFTRNHELRMNTWVAVTPDSPAEVVSTITGLEVVPGEALNRLFEGNDVAGQTLASNMMNLEEAFQSDSAQPVLARIQLMPRGISNKKPGEHGSIRQVELAGSAVFNGEKMVGWLSNKDTRIVMFFLEKLKSGIEVVACPNESAQKVALEFKEARFQVSASYANGNPSFQVRLKTKADIVESGCGVPLADIRGEIESRMEKQMKERIEVVIGKAQEEFGTDFLKFGDVFRNRYPSEWRTLGPRWSQVFPEAEIGVEAEVRIKSGVVKAVGAGIR
ncbi:Ger(x)C family spore germination protein [Paenibacillus sp. LHD-117]|uniref:Ger(x)C family spore germination protein n=1 Tax=Paenibacillus sp. LHD-117 TaxID=3071412 RepID=UPI0027E06156|nr:Ger(x)C family spore germination protein [Paenibacillus sp. LHD-117]MDQ6422432.1 Ger(x)C family spore germination protein [Paenibacillus sp. LHD-117]